MRLRTTPLLPQCAGCAVGRWPACRGGTGEEGPQKQKRQGAASTPTSSTVRWGRGRSLASMQRRLWSWFRANESPKNTTRLPRSFRRILVALNLYRSDRAGQAMSAIASEQP